MIIDTLVQAWCNDPIKVGSIILAIASIATNVFLALRANRDRRPTWGSDGMVVVRKAAAQVDELEVSYQGRHLDCVSISEVYFWNSGRQLIDRSDLAAGDPLRVSVPVGREILTYEFLRVTRDACRPAFGPLSADRQELHFSFDYLDEQDGVVIRVSHTGIRPGDAKILGTIKGCRLIRDVGPPMTGSGLLPRVEWWARSLSTFEGTSFVIFMTAIAAILAGAIGGPALLARALGMPETGTLIVSVLAAAVALAALMPRPACPRRLRPDAQDASPESHGGASSGTGGTAGPTERRDA